MCVDQTPYALLLNPGPDYRQTRLTRRIQLAANSPSPASVETRTYMAIQRNGEKKQ